LFILTEVNVMGGGSAAHSSSSDEDGDAEWRAAIDSIASVGLGLPQSNGAATLESRVPHADDEASQKPGLKLYQVKVNYHYLCPFFIIICTWC
jgi:hypothetical protein